MTINMLWERQTAYYDVTYRCRIPPVFFFCDEETSSFRYVLDVVSMPRAWYRLPLIQDLPELLTTSGARTPTICILFSILVREHYLKCPPMPVEIKDISTGEGHLRRGCEKQFIHGLSPQNPNGWFAGGWSWMSSND